MECRECDGDGRWFDGSHGSSRHCKTCDGTGKIPDPESLNTKAREAVLEALKDYAGAAESAIINLPDLAEANDIHLYDEIMTRISAIEDLARALNRAARKLNEEDE